MMLVSIIIIKLIINLISWYCYFCSAYDCFKIENFGTQFDELENVYKITQKTSAQCSFDLIKELIN